LREVRAGEAGIVVFRGRYTIIHKEKKGGYIPRGKRVYSINSDSLRIK
jgi:hypothetical protein